MTGASPTAVGSCSSPRKLGNSLWLRWGHKLCVSGFWVLLSALLHLEGVESVFVAVHVIAVVDLIQQEGVVDPEHLVLQQSLVYLPVLFLTIRSFLLLLLRIS